MAVSSPYADSEMVALLQKNLLLGATNFTDKSPVPKTYIDQYILWAGSAIDMQLAQAGYLIPLQDLSGETWPTHQTAWLQLVACLGAISLIAPALKPAPGLGSGRTGSGENIVKTAYQMELDRIYDLRTNKTNIRLRAKFYRGTPAELALNEPAGPKADFSRESVANGNLNPNSRMYFWDYTFLQNRLVETFRTNFNWLSLMQLDTTGNLQEQSYDPVTGWQ